LTELNLSVFIFGLLMKVSN